MRYHGQATVLIDGRPRGNRRLSFLSKYLLTRWRTWLRFWLLALLDHYQFMYTADRHGEY
jgi:hypothetical protein